MVSRSQLMSALASAVFLGGCAYVGYANELLKETIPTLHRAALMIGFIIGAGAASRWIMVLDIKRNMAKIKRSRANRKSAATNRR